LDFKTIKIPEMIFPLLPNEVQIALKAGNHLRISYGDLNSILKIIPVLIQ